MRKQRIWLLPAILLIGLVSVLPASGEPPGISVTGADSVLEMSMSVATSLVNTIATVDPRPVVQYANTIKYYDVAPIPGSMQSLLTQLQARIRIYAANSSQNLELGYPVELVKDITAPVSDGARVEPAGGSSATITWTTDEYADSEVRCGTQSGTYTIIAEDPLYVKVHSVTLTGLTAGIKYYCLVKSTDLSGNTYTSAEFSFEQMEEVFVFLPLVLRK